MACGEKTTMPLDAKRWTYAQTHIVNKVNYTTHPKDGNISSESHNKPSQLITLKDKASAKRYEYFISAGTHSHGRLNCKSN